MAGNTDKLLKRHAFCFNKETNGGEALTLVTKMFANGDPNGVYWNQELTLHSYCNSASINLYGPALTPKLLRELANQLEFADIEAKAMTHNYLPDREIIEEVFRPNRDR